MNFIDNRGRKFRRKKKENTRTKHAMAAYQTPWEQRKQRPRSGEAA
jgi:hypothetical protein